MNDTPSELENIDRVAKPVTCPNCHAQLSFRLTVGIKSVREITEDSLTDATIEVNKPPTTKLARIIDSYRECGLLNAYRDALEGAEMDNMPQDIGLALVRFLREARHAVIPQEALTCLLKDFNARYVKVFHHGSISIIVADNEIRCFVPTHILRGDIVRRSTIGQRISTPYSTDGLVGWLRTRRGYVAGKGYFYDELQRTAFGALNPSSKVFP